ncbi:conserved hypothetical protein [Cyanobium sp. PCC 7001]|uniref:DUF883 family protein n=1 Tax=Cyanobium sp. PCC 7001 TaxID=180281 RepID=UPI000180531B|nr:DUF883 family protein [Cyanobium sp. PCC 7001]EDY37298.1 conserved hypothetical protein [Cyanobium sp. PCC 7001]
MTSTPPQDQNPEAQAAEQEQHHDTFRERFDALLPTIQREWPQVARQTLEATRGSFDEVAEVIASQTGRTVTLVKHQLVELLDVAGAQTSRIADRLTPLEKQLEGVLDDLNATLRPRIEKPVRERPLMAIGIAAGVGVLVGMLLSSGRRSA